MLNTYQRETKLFKFSQYTNGDEFKKKKKKEKKTLHHFAIALICVDKMWICDGYVAFKKVNTLSIKIYISFSLPPFPYVYSQSHQSFLTTGYVYRQGHQSFLTMGYYTGKYWNDVKAFKGNGNIALAVRTFS